MARWREAGTVYEAANLFRQRCLLEGSSFLWPERTSWNEQNLSLMWDAFVGDPDEGKRTFFEKWQDQLNDQPEDVHRIAADLLAFYYLSPTNIGFDTKMSNLRRVIGWKLADDSTDLNLVEDAFRTGVGKAGMLYNTKMPWQMTFYLQFFSEVLSKELDSADLEVCRNLAREVRSEVKSSNPAYNILLHLLFPDRFERTAADSHKHRIVEAFRDMSGEKQDVDEALENIRGELVREYGREDLDFYDEDIRFRWDSSYNKQSDGVPNTEQYVEALGALEDDLPESYKRILEIHYTMPNKKITATQLAKAVRFQNYNGANLHYGKLGLRVGRMIGWQPSMHMEVMVTFEKLEGEWHWFMRPEVAEALEILSWVGEGNDETEELENEKNEVSNLNTILFGPPGTGKTYSVQRKAVEVIEASAAELSGLEVAEKFRSYRRDGRIEFVTFHPSFSYEEFVEGFRYDPEKRTPTLHDGIFKKICDRALNPNQSREVKDEARIWKVSLGSADQPQIFERCMENGEIAIGWLKSQDLSEEVPFWEGEPRLFEDQLRLLFEENYPEEKKSPQSVLNFVRRMSVGDYVAVRGSKSTVRAIGVVTGDYEFREDYDEYPHTRRVEWLDGKEHDIQKLNGGRKLTQQAVYELERISIPEIVGLLPPENRREKPYVLVIDEINRGNISRIFGELITLLEPDKRRGAENELSVRLPYSQQDFSVPGNLHVIGTMNTADRSIALLDVALRRRFEFEEMMPDAGVIRTVLTERDADVDVSLVCNVFDIINARISVLLDRDHQLGHAYFLSATSPDNLHHALYKRIFPLLQEYFYNDPERLRKLLGKFDGEAGFVEDLKQETGYGFTEETNADGLWKFHIYEASELEDALDRTFVSGG